MPESNDSAIGNELIPAPLGGIVMRTNILEGIPLQLDEADSAVLQRKVQVVEALIDVLKITARHWPFMGCGVPGPTLDEIRGDLLAIADSSGKRALCDEVIRRIENPRLDENA